MCVQAVMSLASTATPRSLFVFVWFFDRLLEESFHENQFPSVLQETHHKPEVQFLLLLLVQVQWPRHAARGFIRKILKDSPYFVIAWRVSSDSCLCIYLFIYFIFIFIFMGFESEARGSRRKHNRHQCQSDKLTEETGMSKQYHL